MITPLSKYHMPTIWLEAMLHSPDRLASKTSSELDRYLNLRSDLRNNEAKTLRSDAAFAMAGENPVKLVCTMFVNLILFSL